MASRSEQGQATRKHIVGVAISLFASQGYEDTSIGDALAAAGVSRGALYHHFTGKETLFDASLQFVEGLISKELHEAIAGAPTALAALRAVALRWIDLAGNPVISRIVLIDAPSVLGWERWRLQGGQALSQIRTLLQAVADEGHLELRLVNSFAHMILAAVDEIALVAAQADDPKVAITEGRSAVDELIHRLVA